MELDDLKVQIHSKLKKTNIIFNEYADYKKLSKDYDYVIIGNGDPSVAKELGCWTDWVNAYVKGAVVLGDFDPNTFIVWVNKDYCKNGYAYLSPFDKKRASVVLVVTDVNEKEVDHYWELFLQTENIQYRILENYKLKHTSGIAKPHRVNNMLLVGNAGGAMDPFLGFGVLGSLLTGVMSARSIVTNKDYEKLISKIVKKNLQFYEFRKAFNDMNNSYFDILISSIDTPVIKQLIYDTSLNVVNLGAHLLKIKNRLARK
jgi:flavin-dependent dehydrogenase